MKQRKHPAINDDDGLSLAWRSELNLEGRHDDNEVEESREVLKLSYLNTDDFTFECTTKNMKKKKLNIIKYIHIVHNNSIKEAQENYNNQYQSIFFERN